MEKILVIMWWVSGVYCMFGKTSAGLIFIGVSIILAGGEIARNIIDSSNSVNK